MASGFKHDAQGFLIGEVIENGRDLARMQQQGMAIWKDIRSDMKAIRVALSAQAATTQRISRPGALPRAPATTATRGAPSVARGPAAVTQPRGASGRFTAIQRPAGIAESAARAGSIGGSRRMADAVGRLASGLRGSDNIDPTINAAKEIKDVVSPLGRGLFSLFGRTAERKKEVWYRRFLKALTPGARDNKPGHAGGGGGFFGGMGGGVGSMVGSGIGSAAGGMLGGMLGKGKGLLKGGGKLLKRIPILGALIAGAGALGSIFGDGIREEKYKGVGEAGGMLAGGMAGASLGAAIGTAILPGIGTAIGGFLGGVGGALLGEKFGAKVGEWTKSLVDSDIAGKVLEGWNTTTAFLGAAWDSMATDAKAAWAGIATKAGEWLDSAKSGLDAVGKTLSDAGNAVNGWIKDKTGIDVKQNIGEAADSVKNAAGAAWDKTKGVASAGWSAAKGYGADALDAAKSGAAAMVPNTVKRAYNAGAAAATQAKAGFDMARGTENTTGAPMGSLQQGARRAGGSLGDLIAKGEGGYGSFNRGQAGDSRGASLDFSSMTLDQIMAAQSLPKGDPNRLFAIGKYQTIPSTLKGAVQSMGLKGDEKLTPELQERIFAEYLADAKRPAIAGYIRGEHGDLASAQKAGAKEWASIADPATGKSFYAGAGNNKASLSADAFGGALTGARARYRDLVTAGVPSADAYRTVVAGVSNLPSTPAVSIPSSVPSTIPKAPEIKDPAIPLNSPAAGAGRGASTASNPDHIPQNVGDRQIAHVVTGGLGATGRW